MKEPGGRSFTILDAMAIVTALAVGFAGARWAAGNYWRIAVSIINHWSGIISAIPEGSNAKVYARFAQTERNRELLHLAIDPNFLLNVPFFFVLTFTPTMLLLRLRRPRPRWGDLMRQPGAVACAGGLLTVMLAILLDGYVGSHLGALSLVVVPVAWSTVVIGGWWRSEPSWIDRGGRVVGVCWTAAAIYAGWLWATF